MESKIEEKLDKLDINNNKIIIPLEQIILVSSEELEKYKMKQMMLILQEY